MDKNKPLNEADEKNSNDYVIVNGIVFKKINKSMDEFMKELNAIPYNKSCIYNDKK